MKNVEERVEALLAQMTLQEKIGQLNQISSPLQPDEAIFDRIRRNEVGSFIMATTAHAGNDDTDSVEANLFNELQRVAVEETRLGIPIIFGRDVIHGHNTVMPIPLGSAASFDEELVKQCYRDVAKEAARDGVHWTFSPMLDMSRDPRWGRCVEGPGEDPYLGAKMAKALVQGFQGEDLSAEDSIAACAKHYIGYGASEGGRDYHRTEIADYTLRNYYLPGFKAAVDAGVQTVMSSFNEISGQPASSSRYLLTEVLKEELGFDGFVISDWDATTQNWYQGVIKVDDREQVAETCLNAGLDMEMVSGTYVEHLEKLVESGRVTMAQLDDSVRRVLRVKFRLGLFEHPYIPKYPVDGAAHKAHARRLAAESMVLLKNDKAVLPLAKNANIALVGPYANERTNLLGSWCLDGKAEDVTTVLAGIRAGAPECTVHYTDTPLDDEALLNVFYGDVTVLCIGESRQVTGEANSLARIEVGAREIALAKTARSKGKPVVALLFYARPRALEELAPYCDAMLWCWHPGTEAGHAVADILFGATTPGGKLPMTLPRVTGQIPLYYNHTPAARFVNGYYPQGLHTGDTYHDVNDTPLYPFGFGLSYAAFALNDMAVDTAELPLAAVQAGGAFTVRATVKNTAAVAGSEVVQVYIRDKTATMSRPIRALKGYAKVWLQPGEAKTVELKLGFDALGFYNAAGKFAVEPGEFEVFVGTDCYAEKIATVTVV